jgi:site-specific recombinase XerD
MGEDIHNSRLRYEIGLRLLRNSSISEKNKELIEKFCEDCFSQGIKHGRMRKYIYILRKIAEWLGKDFDKAEVEDIKRVVAIIEMKDFSEWTKHDYKVSLKKFYRWLRKEKNPREIEWIKTNNPKNRRLPEELLTEEDVKRLIDAAPSLRDKALISFLYESGCRVGELASIKIKHLSIDKYGARVLLNGKTGPRRIRIIASVPYLIDWLNNHPRKDPNSYLWVSRKGRLRYEGIRTILVKTAERAGISKRVNPHMFRHSRATFLANHLTEAQLKEYFGWVQDSDMASVYVHLSGRDVDKAILKVYGIQGEEEKKDSKLKPRECMRCKEINPVTNMFCSRCSMPLDEKTLVGIVERDLERKNFDKIMEKLWEDDSFKQFFLEKIKELKEKGLF